MKCNLLDGCKKKVKEIKARPIKLRKRDSAGNVKEYNYYIVPLNVYINKPMVNRWGIKYLIEMKKCKDEIVIRLKPLLKV